MDNIQETFLKYGVSPIGDADVQQSFYITAEEYKSICAELKEFAEAIRVITPEEKYKLLEKFITYIIKDSISENFKIEFKIKHPASSFDSDIIILEKTLYFSLD